ncbi:MAG: transporter ATP-binding protein [Glaciihabitans sp.]|nr:transporter ATP-binding protein [Glaciihabitans sp.]
MSAVTVTNVSSDYEGVRVLDGVDARFPRGAVTAIGGPNGAGKSTLLGILAGTQPPSAGTVALAPRERIGFVVQRSAVSDRFPLTVRETVAMGRWGGGFGWHPLRRRDHTIINESLAALRLNDLADRPLGALSGGQRQRALVAQGLARRASLLLLDEPTAGVDADSYELISLAIRREAERGAAVIHATHDEGTLAEADQRIMMRAGQIVRTGQNVPAAQVAPVR